MCENDFEIVYWDFNDYTAVRTVFGFSWVFILSSIFTIIVTCISGNPAGALMGAISAILAVSIFCFIPLAIENDTPECKSPGPCDSLFGLDDSVAGTTHYWGPTFGWYCAILAACWLILVFIVGCACQCVFKSRKSYTPII